MEALLTVAGLECTRNGTTLFTSIGFELGPRGILQVLGPNGSGKTTLLRILCGLRQPDAGIVRWRGFDVRRHRADFLGEIRYVGHSNGVSSRLTVWENLSVSRALAPFPGPLSTREALRRLGLEEQTDIPAGYLSSGQRRRLALARLPLPGTGLWLLDEPFAALDEAGRGIFREMLAAHCAAGGLAVLALHGALDVEGVSPQYLSLPA